MTPAMAAGVTAKLSEVSDLVALLVAADDGKKAAQMGAKATIGRNTCLMWRNRAETALVVAVVAFWGWLWLLAVLRPSTPAPGLVGYVTGLLAFVYVVGVPFFALLAIGMALLSVIWRYASATRLLVEITIVLAISVFWAWSFSAQFDFLKRRWEPASRITLVD